MSDSPCNDVFVWMIKVLYVMLKCKLPTETICISIEELIIRVTHIRLTASRKIFLWTENCFTNDINFPKTKHLLCQDWHDVSTLLMHISYREIVLWIIVYCRFYVYFNEQFRMDYFSVEISKSKRIHYLWCNYTYGEKYLWE